MLYKWDLSLYQGSTDDEMIFMVSGTMKLPFLLGNSAEIENYQKSFKSVGTADEAGRRSQFDQQ